jgi:hypothetical protein
MEPESKIYRQKHKSKAGIALVEAIVAVAVFAFFITSACKMLVMHRKMSDGARNHYTAINIAKNRMELVRTFDFGQTGDFIEDKVVVNDNGQPDQWGDFRRTTQFSMVDTNLLELAVTVEIRDRKTLAFEGDGQHLTTFFAEYLTEESSVGSGTPPGS